MDAKNIASFWNAVDIFITKPHIINKRLWGSNLLFKKFCQINDCNWDICLNSLKLKNPDDVPDFMENLFNVSKLQPLFENVDLKEKNIVEVLLMKLLPKNFEDNCCYQLVILNKNVVCATFYDVTPALYDQNVCPNFTYSIQLLNKVVIIGDSDHGSKSYQWLQNKVLPQIIRWMDPNLTSTFNKSLNIKDSLALVAKEKYYSKYNNLKLKYGKEMVKIWPESTDPKKFVYEDVAIATYLLLLWDEKNAESTPKPVTFVDIGCGNGLLVYILTKEGHKGLGVDVRKRKIWDIYDESIKLEERIVTPENIHTFSGYDWIIGNHSDELTPWIPVITSISAYSSKFFLLPCCAYNFDGTKYQRKNSSKSQYNEYLDYICKLCNDCGFETETDRLKIPSTKRICFIGRTRSYHKEEHEIYKNKTLEIVNKGYSSGEADDTSFEVNDFKPRNPVEKVRNCTQLDKSVIENIVNNITNSLLEGCNFNNEWNPGKEVCIVELIKVVPQKALSVLKASCGGLQTLLRNNHHIFKIEKGKVQLKYPKTIEETMTNLKKQPSKNSAVKVQVRPCWFYKNHPQGCPLNNSDCSFLHEAS